MSEILITGLTKHYQSLVAVDRLHLNIGKGELFALLGVNGAGKTTTIKMLTCLTKPSSGDASIGGFCITREPEQIKRLIGVSPQETAIAPNLSVRENLELICGIHGFSKEKSKERIQALTEQFHLEPVLSRKAGRLSGGWQRRISIAMALISEPSILFLDEPTLGLDVLARHDLWEVIRSLQGKITIILTTHYMEEAAALSDRIGIMQNGRLLAAGTVDELNRMAGVHDFETAFLSLVKDVSITQNTAESCSSANTSAAPYTDTAEPCSSADPSARKDTLNDRTSVVVMRRMTFAGRCTREILRDPVNLGFGLGFPLILLLLLRAIQANIPNELFAIDMLTPGITVFGSSFLALFSATLIAKDRETSFLQRLYTTPLTSLDFILGYMLPLLPFVLGQTVLCYLFAIPLGLPLRPGILYASLGILPMAVFYISLGLFFGSLLNVKQVGGICGALLTNLSAWFSGVWFDLDLVGGLFQSIANILPFFHAAEMEKALFHGNFETAAIHALPIIGYSILTTTAAVYCFLHQMKQQ